mgnify:FL=1
MANPFLDDFLAELEQIERQKFETEPTPQEDKSFAYDVVGSTLWAFADEAGFGLPEYAARNLGYEEQIESLAPESLTAKIGAGIGALGGFALGLPYKTGTKLAQYAVKPFVKGAVEESGEYILGKTAKQIAKDTKKKAIDAGMKKEVAEDFTNKYISLTQAAGARPDISKDFVNKSTQAIDDLVSFHAGKGTINPNELRIVNNIFKRDLTRKPIGDFKELFSAKNIGGDKAALYGNMADEVIIFGAIDAISEGVRSQAQDRPYDWMAPIWGGAIGVGFGGLKFLAPKGKSSNFRTEMVDGIKGYMNRDIFAKMGQDKLKLQSKWLGEVLSDSRVDKDNIIQSVEFRGKNYTFDLLNPEFLDQHGSIVATNVMRKGLNQLRTSYSKELINFAIKEEWSSLSENFLRMIAGGVIMSSRTIYEITQGADIPAEDIIPTMLIGGWVNRRGMARTYDMHTRTNMIRKNLTALNVDTRNLVLDIPTFNPYLASYNNPTEVNDNIREFRDKAEELGIITDSYEQSELNLDPSAESVLAAEANRGGYDVFKAFYQLLGGQKKYTKPLDRISTKDADTLQNLIKDIKWEQLDGKTVTSAQDAFKVFDVIAQQSSETFERNMVNVINRVSQVEGLNIDTSKLNINDASMGSFPKRFLASDEVVLNESSFLDLAAEGRIIDGLKGPEAVAKVNEYIKKLNLIIEGLGNDGGIARLKLQEPTRDQLVKDKDTFDNIKTIIDEFENAINVATGARNEFKFDTMHHLEDLVWLMHTNNAKKAAEQISSLVSQGAPGHDELKVLLERSGILRLNDDLTMSMINSANKNNIVITKADGTIPENDTRYRRLLSSVIGLLGAKGQYSRRTTAEPQEIKISDVLALESFLKGKGMRTDAFVMDQWNNYVIDFINRKNIEGSELDMNDISFITSLMDNEIAGLAEFSREAGQGYIVSKIQIDETMDSRVKASAESYNAYVDGLLKRGESAKGKVVSEGEAKQYVDPDVIFAVDAEVASIQRNIEGSANKVLTDMLNSLRNNHATFVEQMRVFSNTNGSHALLLKKMLVQAKVLTKEGTGNVTQFKFNEDKLTQKVIKDLKETMGDYGTSFDDIDALLQRENENMSELFSRLDDKPIDTQNSLTQDQFFKRYVSEELSIADQNIYLDSISSDKLNDINPMEALARQANIKFKINNEEFLFDDLDFNNAKHVNSYKEYLDHAGALLSSRSNSTKKVILSFDNGNTSGKYRTMQNTPFMKFLDSIGYKDGNIDGEGLNYYFVSGSADNLVQDGRGIRRKHFSIFDGDSQNLSPEDKTFLDSQRQLFEDNLNGLNGLEVRTKMSVLDTESISFDGGLALFRISSSVNPIAIPKKELFKITDAYKDMLERNKDALGSRLYNEGLDRVKKLESNPTVKSFAHETALRQLMFEKLLSSKNNSKNFIDALKGNLDDLGKLGGRFNLFHTPNFKRLDKKVAKSMAVTAKEKTLVNQFHSRGAARVAIWNDKDNASVKESLLNDPIFKNDPKAVDDFFRKDLYARGDETSYDSITYISKDYMDYLKIAYSRNFREGTELFKPVISSNEDALLFGKTVFVYEPKLDKFFGDNKVDILTTASASKVKGEGWKTIEATDAQLPNLKLSKGVVRNIPLESVGIKQDRVKDKDMAKFSIQAYNYLSSAEANSIFGEMYSSKLNNAMSEMQQLYDNPLRRRAFFQQGFSQDQSVESLMETGAGSQNLAAALRYSQYGDPIDLGQKMIMSQFYRKLVDPVVNQTAMLDGQRVGGKAVLIQSLDRANKVKPTIFRNGKLEQYGEIMIPAHEADEMLSMKPGDKNKVRILERKTNKILELQDVFGSRFKDEQIDQMTLGDLHDSLDLMFPKGKYQVAIVTNRYPRTRPNDMTIMGLKGFLDEQYGNSMIVNELDVLNIFEGDYDVDKNDYYFRHSKNMFDHIQEAQHNFIQGVDPGRFAASIPNLALTGDDAALNQAWHTHAANANVLRAGIGVVQKLQRSLNWFKDKLGAKDEESGLYDVLTLKDSKGNVKSTIKMDYDNKDWWHRTVLETQAIIDAGTGVDGKLIDIMGNWRSDYLFPSVFKFRNQIEGQDKETRRNQYLEELRNGEVPDRIPLFRKFDENGKEVEAGLDSVEKEMILYHLNKYGKFLSLSTNIYDNSGMGKKPSYHDIIDYSDDFFSYAANHNTMFYALNNKFKFNKDKYTSSDRRRLREYFQTNQFETTNPDGSTKTVTYPEGTPFTEDFKINMENSAKGTHGNVYDRLMWNIFNSDPMKARTYSGLVGNEIKQLDDMFQRVAGDADYDQFTTDVLAFAKSQNKQINTLAFLKRKYGFLNRLRVSAKRKKELIDANNRAIAELEIQLEGTLPYNYKKSKSAKDLKDARIKILDIDSSQQLKDDSTVLYTLEELVRHNYGNKGMMSEIDELKTFERRVFSDNNNLGETLPYEQRTAINQDMKDYLANMPNYSTVNEMIEMKLRDGVDKHGFSFLFHYAMPAKQNAVGIFNGVAHAVSHKRNARFERILKFMGKNADEVEFANALKVIGHVSSYYRNYFNKNHRLLNPDNMRISEDIYAFADGMKFPKFSKGMQDAFDSFKSFKWKKQTGGNSDPFKIQDDYSRSFYRDFFETTGKGDEFDRYMGQRSILQHHLMSTQHVDPIAYLSMISKMDQDIHEFASKKITGAVDHDGRFWKFDKNRVTPELRKNPIYHLLGGDKYFKGIALNFPKRQSRYDISSMKEFSKQANTIIDEAPSDRKAGRVFDVLKSCGVGGS